MGDGGEGPGFGGFWPFLIGYEGSIAIPHFPDEDSMLRAILKYPFSPQLFPHEFLTIQ